MAFGFEEAFLEQANTLRYVLQATPERRHLLLEESDLGMQVLHRNFGFLRLDMIGHWWI
jgi:hypothetical protein